MFNLKPEKHPAVIFAFLALSGLLGQFLFVGLRRDAEDILIYLVLFVCQFVFIRFSFLFLDEIGVRVTRHKKAYYICTVVIICAIRLCFLSYNAFFLEIESIAIELIFMIFLGGISVLLCLALDKLFYRP